MSKVQNPICLWSCNTIYNDFCFNMAKVEDSLRFQIDIANKYCQAKIYREIILTGNDIQNFIEYMTCIIENWKDKSLINSSLLFTTTDKEFVFYKHSEEYHEEYDFEEEEYRKLFSDRMDFLVSICTEDSFYFSCILSISYQEAQGMVIRLGDFR